MTIPDPEPDFAARCAHLCPGFRSIGEPHRARKSELLWGELDGAQVIAKRVLKPNPVWDWYLEREIAMYRALTDKQPGVRMPRLVAAGGGVLVMERLVGEPLATKRRPDAALPIRTIAALIAIHDQLASWSGNISPPPAGSASPGRSSSGAGSTPAGSSTGSFLPPSPRVHAQMRERLLEDPTDPTWVRDGVQRNGRRGLLEEGLARRVDEAIAAYSPVTFGHGDLLLRNVIIDEDEDIGIIDWECAGMHVRDWDLALLWSQLAPAARTIVEDAVQGTGLRWRAFLGLVVFAFTREIRFLQTYDDAGNAAPIAKLREEIDRAAARLIRD